MYPTKITHKMLAKRMEMQPNNNSSSTQLAQMLNSQQIIKAQATIMAQSKQFLSSFFSVLLNPIACSMVFVLCSFFVIPLFY